MSGQENNNTQAEELNETGQAEFVEEAATKDMEVNTSIDPHLPGDVETLQSLLEKEKEQAKASLETALRAQAEMDNLRKRTARDIENAHKYALEKFVNELLPIMDSMELGMNVAESAENIDDLKEGMSLTLKMFNSAMEKFGVTVLAPEGEKFNPEKHEAVSVQEVEGSESGTVISVMQKGYELNGRLVRPAMVIVAK